MLGALYKTKKDLKAAKGEPLLYVETSMFGAEYRENGTFAVVGPDPFLRRTWYAQVTMRDGKIEKVS